MAVLTTRAPSSEQFTQAGGLSHDDIVRIVIGIVLAVSVVVVLWLFWSGKYHCITGRCKSSTSATAPRPPSVMGRVRGRPTAFLPRFARDAASLPQTSSEAARPISSRLAGPTGMLKPHPRRGSEASTNSRVGLLRAAGPVPTSPPPAFLGGRVTTISA